MCDEDWRMALKVNHQKLRTGIIVAYFLPELRLLFTDVEYSQVESKLDNVAQVDEVVRILLTKTGKHFDKFCEILECNGYPNWAKRLRSASSHPLQVKADSEGRAVTGSHAGTVCSVSYSFMALARVEWLPEGHKSGMLQRAILKWRTPL